MAPCTPRLRKRPGKPGALLCPRFDTLAGTHATGYISPMAASNDEPLADLVTREFAAMHRQFAAINGRFAAMDSQFATIHEAMRRESAAINTRFDRLETAVDRIAVEVVALNRRIDHLEAYFERKFDDLTMHFDDVHRRIERLEQEQLAMSEALRRTNRSGDEEQARREDLARRVAELEREIAVLRGRVAMLEQQRPA